MQDPNLHQFNPVQASYEPEDTYWVSISRLGSIWLEEMDPNRPNHYRHRSCFNVHGPWKRGKAPT